MPSRMTWGKLLCSDRVHTDKDDGKPYTTDARTEFQRDFDRIVFSSAFRRMQDKTQVFPLANSDFVRTRLTHSFEVSSVGRSLGFLVGSSIQERVTEDGCEDFSPHDMATIVAAACLAHDIGNPPFGHSGESSISAAFKKKKELLIEYLKGCEEPLLDTRAADLLNFEGNAQGFRIITRLQNPGKPGGLRLTCATLGAFSKYPRQVVENSADVTRLVGEEHKSAVYFKKHGFFQEDMETFSSVADKLGLIPCGDKGGAWIRHPLAFLMEAADDISYRVVDLEDGFRLGYISFEQAKDLLEKISGSDGASAYGKDAESQKDYIGFLRARSIGMLIEECSKAFVDNYENVMRGGLNQSLTDIISKKAALDDIKDVITNQVYNSPTVLEVELAGFEVLDGLVSMALDGFISLKSGEKDIRADKLMRLLGLSGFQDGYSRILRMTDFMSGMTDSYAVALFKKLKGVSIG